MAPMTAAAVAIDAEHGDAAERQHRVGADENEGGDHATMRQG